MTARAREAAFLIAMLAFFGALWGGTQPLTKIAVSGEYRAPGLIFWQLVIGAVFLGVVNRLRGNGLPFGRAQVIVFVFIALVGKIFPNLASFEAIRHLPSGLTSILLSLIPMLAFPIAILMRNEGFSWRRFSGLGFGLVGVMLIVLPEASLPDRAVLIFVPLAMVAPFFYALEGNAVARWGTAGMDPVQVLYGASIIGAVIALPLAVLTGEFIDPRGPWGAADAAVVASSIMHAVAYTGYVWMVGRAGPVFAVQVSYLVTGFGVIWAMIFLGESYSGWIWAAMGLMFAGMFLVQPRPKEPLAPVEATGKDTA